ncbi:MAG: hypothetical protein ACRD1K_14770 [Acidimicrobiales bacterium]
MTPNPRHLFTATATFMLLATAACGDGSPKPGASAPTAPAAVAVAALIDPGDGGNYRPAIDPSRFVTEVDNPFLPLVPGSHWVYEGTSPDGIERIEVVVTDQKRTILGIEAVVVRDTVTMDGVVFEDTFDWYAQDVDGNVWYLGEATEEHEDGKISTAGSWEAGVDGARPGIVMQARPAVGTIYRQEFYKGEAEDLAEIVRTGQSATVAAGSYRDLVVIKEWNPFHPAVLEEKYFAPGIGLVLEVETAGGTGRVELVEFTPGR